VYHESPHRHGPRDQALDHPVVGDGAGQGEAVHLPCQQTRVAAWLRFDRGRFDHAAGRYAHAKQKGAGRETDCSHCRTDLRGRVYLVHTEGLI
jgi:hypothetical protein